MKSGVVMRVDPEIKEIIDNKPMLKRSLNHAKKRLLINGNKQSNNSFLNNQIADITSKLRKLAQWEHAYKNVAGMRL
jgi:hypothetical protein